jgi:hypothetical protein
VVSSSGGAFVPPESSFCSQESRGSGKGFAEQSPLNVNYA